MYIAWSNLNTCLSWLCFSCLCPLWKKDNNSKICPKYFSLKLLCKCYCVQIPNQAGRCHYIILLTILPKTKTDSAAGQNRKDAFTKNKFIDYILDFFFLFQGRALYLLEWQIVQGLGCWLASTRTPGSVTLDKAAQHYRSTFSPNTEQG